MSSRCLSSSCLNGNCEGCKNKVKFCNDPRCYPDCPDCSDETSSSCVNRRDGWDWTFLAIIGALALVLLIILLYMGWGTFNNGTNNESSTLYVPTNEYSQYSQGPSNIQRSQVRVTTVQP